MIKYVVCLTLLGMLLTPKLSEAKGVDLAADTVTRDEHGVVIAKGDVEVKRQGEILKADEIHYDAKKNWLEATGHVEIVSPRAHIQAESGVLHTENKTGELKHAELILPQGERLQAESLQRLSESKFSADHISFTTCPADAEAWRLHADHIELDQNEGVMTAHGARFDVAGVPVFYTPYWQHPLRRRSGILLPTFTSSSNRGTEYALPYYWAPSDNWDATITPRWMTARGLMGEIELRHVSELGSEKVQWAGLRDTLTQGYRQHIQTNIEYKLLENWQFHANVDHVSDRDFLSDFALNNRVNSTRYLSSDIGLAWQGERGDISLSTLYKQDLTKLNDNATLQILPRLESRYALSMRDVNLHLDQQTTRFDRKVGVDGWRVALHPWLELPFSVQGGAVSSVLQVGLRQLRYGQLGAVTTTQNIRTIYDASFETRSSFERVSNDKRWRHSISPIVRYDFASAPNQEGTVNFDSGFGKLTLHNLLTGNRFTGLDRFERMNRISLMLETGLQHKNKPSDAALNMLTARVGVAYDMLRQNVDAKLQTAQIRPFSNVVGELVVSPIRGITADASGVYDPVKKFWGTAQAGLRLQHTKGHKLHVRWQRVDARYSTATELISGGLDLKLLPRWRAFGQMQYDARIKSMQQASAGAHYQHSCWDFKLEAYRNLNRGSAGTADLGYRFLLGFKGLGSVGDS